MHKNPFWFKLEHTAELFEPVCVWSQRRRLLKLGWRPESLQPVFPRHRCLNGSFAFRVKICRAGFRSALLKQAICTLPTWAGSTLSCQSESHTLFCVGPALKKKTLQSWGGKVSAVHSAGAYWAPGFANHILLLQVFYHPTSKPWKMQATDIFTYNMVHCPGAENTANATALLCTIVRWRLLLPCFGNLRSLSSILGHQFFGNNPGNLLF